MESLFQNIRKNIMGTISFDAKFQGMRKVQDFIVYPITEENQSHIMIQSENRYGRIDLNNKALTLSANHASYANLHKLIIDIQTGKAKQINLNNVNLSELIEKIKETGSKNLVGESFVKTDNSGALSISL